MVCRTTEKGLNVIRSFEGRALRAYQDEVGVWTIGYGLTNYDRAWLPWQIKRGLVITEQQAEDLLRVSLEKKYEPAVAKALLKTGRNAPTFDAGASFHFNTGHISAASWPKMLEAGNETGAVVNLRGYNHAGGKVLSGLTRRRNREVAMIMHGDYGPEGKDNRIAVPTKGAPAPVEAPGQRPDDTPGMLREGSTGPAVAALNNDLRALGYDVTDGEGYSFDTTHAVTDFQGHHPNLTADGVAGPATRAAIKREADLRRKVKDAVTKAGGAGTVAVGAWKLLGLTVGQWGLAIVTVALVAFLLWVALHYRHELGRLVNRLLGRVVP